MEKYINEVIKSINNYKYGWTFQDYSNEFILGVDAACDLIDKRCSEIKIIIASDLVLKIEQLIELNQPAAKKIMCKEKYDELFNKYLEILNS